MWYALFRSRGASRTAAAHACALAAAALLALRIGNTRQAAPLVMVNAEPASPRRAAAGVATGGHPAEQHLYPDK